ncbi:MAG: ATP-binding protein [Chromatiaceae bacterium]|nr:ATP-binding protein [Chromatiaceae bacterium]
MTQARLKLPLGIQTFSKLREEGCYYVDKTPLLLKLVEGGTHYFLSRPRRFGKSLLLDTLAELFECNEPLFRGLYIHDRWDWSRRAPVIRLSFAEGVLHEREALDAKIDELLEENESYLGLSRAGHSRSGRFSRLISAAHEMTGERVVVLVDEYDKPILDNLTDPEAARALRDGLRDLYSVIKGQDAHIRFAFLTGVSKFSKVSIFSGLNNLNDITLDASYSSICGYTEADLDEVFAPELEELDRAEIRHWYNGYNWTGEAVYNPFDLLLLFDKRTFRPWWFETGTPTFLIQLLTERQVWLPELDRLETDADLLSSFDVDHIATEALLFQSGYLTIAEELHLEGSYFYRLCYPNREVEQSLNAHLLRAWSPDETATVKRRIALLRLLRANDFSGIEQLFRAFFASIPNDWYRKNPIARYEGYYASVFYSHFAALGLDLRLEDVTQVGRIDMTLHFNGQWYLFEFKVVEQDAEGRALAQIKARGYADKYRASGEPMHLIGLEFSRAQRALVGFEVESLS